MIELRFRPGWDEQRVQQLLAELENQVEEERAAPDEAAATQQSDEAVFTVPVGLLPEIGR